MAIFSFQTFLWQFWTPYLLTVQFIFGCSQKRANSGDVVEYSLYILGETFVWEFLQPFKLVEKSITELRQ